MKKFKFLAFALFAVLACVNFASCSDDDDDNSIVGTWIEKGVDDGEAYENTYIFNADGTGATLWNGENGDSFHYVYTKPMLTIEWNYGETEILSVEWINKSTIRLYDGKGEDYTISRQ